MSPEGAARLNTILTDLYARAQTPSAKNRAPDRERDVGYAKALIGNLVEAEVQKRTLPAEAG
jgi:hypothetical protein